MVDIELFYKIISYLITYFRIAEIMNPNTPITTIPRAEIFVTVQNSFLLGFLSASHTLLHFNKNDVNAMIYLEILGF